jgi:hypothetical protein
MAIDPMALSAQQGGMMEQPATTEPPIFTADVPPQFTGETFDFGIPGISDQRFVSYLNVVPDRRAAQEEAKADQIWAQVAREYGILTGEQWKDKRIWEDHRMATVDPEVDDPMRDNPDATEEFLRRLMTEGEDKPTKKPRRARVGAGGY